MKKIYKILSLVLSLLILTTLISGCASESAKKELQANFKTFMDDLFVSEIESNTLYLHYTVKNPENYGITESEVKLFSLTNEYSKDKDLKVASSEDEKYLDDLINKIRSFNRLNLTTEQRVVYDTTLYYIRNIKNSLKYEFYESPFDYISGVQSNLPINLAEYQFYNKQDVENYLTLISQIPEYLEYCIDYESVRVSKNLGLSDTQLTSVIKQCNDVLGIDDSVVLTADSKENYLISTFNSKINELAVLTDTEKQTFISQNKTAYTKYIKPAYENLTKKLAEFKGKGVENISDYPDYQAYYELLVKKNTGSTKTIEEIITLLSNDLQNSTYKIYNEEFRNPNSTSNYYANFINFSNSPTEILDYLKTSIAKDFPEITESTYTVKNVDSSLEDVLSPAFYIVPEIDNYTENTIYINQKQTDTQTIYSTLAHEGYPGHLYQTVDFYSKNNYPIRTVYDYIGYVEGWAVYSENYAYSYYPTDAAYAKEHTIFGRYNTNLNLNVSSRIDIGVNYQDWSIADVQNYLIVNGLNGDIAKTIYEYVMQSPANYLKYYVGYLEFIELKNFMSSLMEFKFTDMDFHKAVLSCGPAPFSVVKDAIIEYVNSYNLK